MNKTLSTMFSHSLRELVSAVNEKSIQKEDIVNLLKVEDNYILLYYK